MKHPKARGGMFLVFLAVLAIATLIIMLLWNWLIPAIFEGPTVTYLQAFGLLALSKILLGGMGRLHESFHRHRDARQRAGCDSSFDLRGKMHGMSREERREYIRKKMHAHGTDPGSDRECWEAVYDKFFCSFKSECKRMPGTDTEK